MMESGDEEILANNYLPPDLQSSGNQDLQNSGLVTLQVRVRSLGSYFKEKHRFRVLEQNV
jgi:hypothetical protein